MTNALSIASRTLLLCSLLVAVGCPQKTDDPSGPAKPSEPAKPGNTTAGDHGAAQPLGQLTIGGYTFTLARLGSLAPGTEGAVTATATKTPANRDWKKANLYVWAEAKPGERASTPSKAIVEAGRLHLHVAVDKGKKAEALVFRLREGDADLRKRVTLVADSSADGKAGPKHAHVKTPHDGIVARFGERNLWLELKLHDDKGDLELWLAADAGFATPHDLAVDARPVVTFIDADKKKVTLAPRDTTRNEDEDGKPNLRDGKTNYFIFPGATGADATWLKGKRFQSVVTVHIPGKDGPLTSDELVLKPHTHNAAGGH